MHLGHLGRKTTSAAQVAQQHIGWYMIAYCLVKKIHDLDHEVFVASKRPKLGSAETPPKCHKLQRKAMTKGIDKNKILNEYSLACQKNGTLHRTAAVKQGEPTKKPTTYPTIAQLVRDCEMKPSLNYQYRVDDLTLDNVIMILMREKKKLPFTHLLGKHIDS
jgi:hypothetical protein